MLWVGYPDRAPVLIAAHYDTCGPQPGADDNAAAIAMALASVGPLHDRHLSRDVLFAFFDAEEPPFYLSERMGSVHWYHHQRKHDVHACIALDLVGHDVPIPGLADLVFITGMESNADLAAVLRACEPADGIRVIPTLNCYIGDLSDHHVFRVNQRPYLFLSCGRWEHYHQPTDTPEKLNYEKIAAIGGFLVDVIEQVCRADLAGSFEGYDSTETELYFLKRAVGPFVRASGLALENRAHIDRVAQTMIRQFRL